MRLLSTIILTIAMCFTGVSTAYNHTSSEVNQICRVDYEQCLTLLPEFLVNVELSEDAWYVFKTYQFEALFQLNHLEKLKQETAKFVDTDQGSVEFQFLTTTYYAKTLFADKQDKKGFYYLDKAKGLYQKIKSNVSNPLYLVNYGNIILIEAHRHRHAGNVTMAKRKYLEAKQMLLMVKKNYYHYNNPVFQLELYSNLSHCSAFLEQYSAAIEYSKKALFWSRQNDNLQQVGVAHFNLARSFQQAKQYTKARQAFIRSLEYFHDAKDHVSAAVTYLRLAEISVAIGDKQGTKKYLSEVDTIDAQYPLLEKYRIWKEKLKIHS